MGMGDPKAATSSTAIVALSLDSEGKVQYDKLLRQGASA
jgi:hypothetical protein